MNQMNLMYLFFGYMGYEKKTSFERVFFGNIGSFLGSFMYIWYIGAFFGRFLVNFIVMNVSNVHGCTYIIYKNFFRKSLYLWYFGSCSMYMRNTSMYIGG